MNVIDIGSNSVRSYDGKNKTVITTRLAEGMSGDVLSPLSIARTVEAIKKLSDGIESVAFATEAVRRAKNRDEFLGLVYSYTGLTVHVLSGEEEAEISFLGATAGCKERNAVIDLGGASCEIIFGENGKISFSRSFPFGCVTLTDKFGQDKPMIVKYVSGLLDVPPYKYNRLFAVGGTVTSLAAMKKELRFYDRQAVNGTTLSESDIDGLIASVEVGKVYPTLSPERRKTIVAGGAAVCAVMQRLGGSITVSENDNLEGYVIRYLM